ncbi:hypothetical protein [Botrimarina mediterranea]|uniref:hypothetical protein n=1 Tax=Botrimarina mediterranea TaxID=2528022 RepID=UPI0011890B08|nr:hypothetical protein K2D_16430 [Planctomycetes bacterium K2D]
MPLTTQEKQAKWPWRIDEFDRGDPLHCVVVTRMNVNEHERDPYDDDDFPLSQVLEEHFDSVAAAIYAIAKTQE